LLTFILDYGHGLTAIGFKVSLSKKGRVATPIQIELLSCPHYKIVLLGGDADLVNILRIVIARRSIVNWGVAVGLHYDRTVLLLLAIRRLCHLIFRSLGRVVPGFREHTRGLTGSHLLRRVFNYL
jgi:hypothetical protein